MTGHGFVEVVRVREFLFAARCECGHEAKGPNPETAHKRHDIHEAIYHARAALEATREAETSGP